MSSPTRNPPASSAAFQFSPNSFRLTASSLSKPTRALPQGSLALPRKSGRQRNFLRHPADREVANHAVALAGAADGLAREGERRKLFHVEKVGRAQVCVAILLVGVDAGGLDRHRHRGRPRVALVEFQCALELVETAPDFGYEVADLEQDLRVGLVNLVAGHGVLLRTTGGGARRPPWYASIPSRRTTAAEPVERTNIFPGGGSRQDARLLRVDSRQQIAGFCAS